MELRSQMLHDKDRGRISCYARDNHTIITQGSFELKQGGYGIAVRNPVYLNDKNGHEYFWGFTIVILRVPDIFSDSIHALSGFGYEYRLSKTETPWSDTYTTVYQSDGQMTQPVSYDFTIGKENWTFEVTPESGWRNNTLIITVSTIFTAITLLLSGLTRVWLVSRENKNKFQILARTDSLTGIYNRYGFDESAEKMMDKNPKAHFVAALLDIDDFKFINDIYGHAYGDKALKSLADSMKTFFPSDALLESLKLEELKELFSLPMQNTSHCFCHGDFHYANILWAEHHISGILDFELAGYGNREFDIAWALFRRPGQKFLLTERELQEFVRGYRQFGVCDLETVKTYMAQCYVHFLTFCGNDAEYSEYVRRWLKSFAHERRSGCTKNFPEMGAAHK